MSDSDSTPREGPNPSGLCMCGCGKKTKPAVMTSRAVGNIAGQPVRYVKGHHRRKYSAVDYLIDPKSGCWVWQHSKTRQGYGQVTINTRVLRAHRVFYERFNGPIPTGAVVHHTCHNRACVNPEHLEVMGWEEHNEESSFRCSRCQYRLAAINAGED